MYKAFVMYHKRNTDENYSKMIEANNFREYVDKFNRFIYPLMENKKYIIDSIMCKRFTK